MAWKNLPDLFYTYILYDPSRNNEPFYVGKGKGDRAWRHFGRKGIHPLIQRLQFLKRNNIQPYIGIYGALDEEFSLFLEQELISKFGRKDLNKGSLLNLTDGGEIGPKGSKHTFTKTHRDNLSKSSIGKKKSDSAKNNMSLAKFGKPGTSRKGIRWSNAAKIKTPDGIFDSVVDASKFYGIGKSAIYQRCSGHLRTFSEWKIIKEA